MTRKKAVNKGKDTRRRHTPAFKQETLLLADTVGVTEAALQLGLRGSQLYDWRRKLREQASTSQVERDQAAEIAQLKRQLAEQAEELAIVKKAATYFAKNLK